MIVFMLGLGDMVKVKAEETRWLIMCGIMDCVVKFVELVGYLGYDVKKIYNYNYTWCSSELFHITFSGKFEWVCACALDI